MDDTTMYDIEIGGGATAAPEGEGPYVSDLVRAQVWITQIKRHSATYQFTPHSEAGSHHEG
ncbi:uncharacterized protein G2W53_023395 [Senna tora]|uniref:Uncharacterized protein n=1 Tax=Senna tora TaxID=362788 RepID=A0A834WC65_9FABA|nr:uncharacterized protein G2W53_023395 [Senna tora]